MNRYPIWKYVLIVISLLIAVTYTLPNFFGEAPAVQVSAGKVTTRVDEDTLARVDQALRDAGTPANMLGLESGSVRARFDSTDVQIKAKDAIERALNPDPSDAGYIVALNLVSRTPAWLMNTLNAKPMYLGLDLRGGVHFLLQVDMRAALTKNLDTQVSDLRVTLRQKNVRHGGISREGQSIEIRAQDPAVLEAARRVVVDQFADLQVETPCRTPHSSRTS